MARKETGSFPASAKVCPRAVPGRTIAVPATVEIPAEQLTIYAAPPGLITRRNADHIGLSGDELVRIVRAMSRDPRFADQVVMSGKSLRGAPPDAILAYLRAAPPVVAKDGDQDDGSDLDDALLAAAGYKRTTPPKRTAL
jgi:hypothetical protein